MKYLYSLLFVWTMSLSAWAQSGVDYDPENPADPAVFYTLTMEATPRSGGWVETNRMSVEAGKTVYCYANAKTGYAFKQWMVGDSLVSKQSSFRYTMPAHNVALVAFFEYVGYNPENPGDPFAGGYKHNVRVYATPSVGGYFNSSSFTLTEGEVTTIYAYPRNGYRFVSWKKDGKIISTENPLNIKMDTEDLEYTATFVYDPASPEEPGVNNLNVATGELIIDKFSAGNLNSAISSTVGGWENYSLVQSIVVVGQMTSSDFGFSNNLNNCSFIDLSRTTGYTDIPAWSFEGMNALTKIILPSTVKQINNKAFSGCNNLSEFVCYATVPPLLSASAFDSTAGLVVRVPFVSLDLYREADVWKNMTILPLDEDTYSLNVSLPADAGDGRYKNMTLELNNISSGQVLKYVITDRTVYSFANLIKNTKYNVLVKNSLGVVLGTIFDINIIDKDVNIAFDSLLQPRNVSVKIVTPENVDVTSQTTITWFNENGKYLGVGSELKGIVEASKISCRMSLEKELSTQYMTPLDFTHTVSHENNNISLELQPFEKIVISGIVKDLDTGLPLYNANVTISQVLNGKYSKSVVARTDNSGVFSSTINYTSCEIVVAANEYISQEFKIADLKNIDVLNDIQLKKVTGIRVKTDFTYTSSVFEGEVAETIDGYDDYSNISYSIYNKTTQKDITEFKVQSPYILLHEDIAKGDLLSITAISRNGAFKDVTADVIVDVINSINATFPIVEWGKLQVAYNNSTSSKVVGILYDNKGELLRKITYNEASLTLGNLKDGSYTLVTMESSDFFNSILNIDELEKSGLVEDVHFVKNNVTIQSGKITSLVIDNVPDFDDSKFYYTGSNTSFTVNKSSVTVGNYVTLRAKVDFKSKYADKVSDVKLVFDLPESCEFVENSVLTGSGTGGYSVEKNRIVVDVVDMDDVVRFCIIPTSGGECKPSAFVQFMFDGQEIQQPIGTALFEAENLKLITPSGVISQKEIVVGGFAPGNSEIFLYDKNFLIAKTKSYANGKWEIKCDIANGKSYALHNFYAIIVDAYGHKIKSDSKIIIYNEHAMEVKNVTMINGDESVIFDFVNSSTKNISYSYDPNNTDFTFLIDFTRNSDLLLENVDIYVTMSNGEVVELHATYFENKDRWIAFGKFNSSQMPINVSVTYDYTDLSVMEDEKVYEDYLMSFLECIEISGIDRTETGVVTYKIVDHFIGDESLYSTYKCPVEELNRIKSFLEDSGWSCEIDKYYGSSYVKDNNLWISMIVTNDSLSLISTANLKEIFHSQSSQKQTGIQRVTFADRYRGIYTVGENALDRFVRGRLGGLFDLANCKYMCEENHSLSDFPYLEQAIKHLISWQGVKLAFAVGKTANVSNEAIGKPAHSVEALCQIGRTMEAVNGMLDGYEDILNYENELVRTILEYPDNCKCTDLDYSVQYSSIQRSKTKVQGLKCRKGKNRKDAPNDIEPIVDPAGYVYEGVSSNRIEGVMASCYYKETVEDMYGDLHENVVLWNAEEYAQENPLFTDKNGMYRWDVPQGLWQVKFEKEGYETAYSEWLPVPPPQLEVNVAMVQNKQPEVKNVNAYEEGIEIEFDKYMQPASLNEDNIFVVQDGNRIPGVVTMLNEEIAYKGMNDTYASKVRFVFDKPVSGDEITLTVSNRVKNYAGAQMQDNYTQTFDIEKEIKSIVAESAVSMSYGGEYLLTVKAVPAEASAGKTLVVSSLSDMIVSVETDNVVLDNNGEAVIKLFGELPGTGVVDFSIVGYDHKASTVVNVEYANANVTANPVASIPSGSTVQKGTAVTLSCSTAGADIYYTLDGTCPCDETALLYDGSPIIINENTELRIMSVAEGLYDSDVVVYYYYVSVPEETFEVAIYRKWDDVLICDNSSNKFVAYQWYKNDVPVTGETKQFYSEIGGLNGRYYVMAQVENGNWEKSNIIECSNAAKLKVNPTILKRNEMCVVSVNTDDKPAETCLGIFDVMGRMVKKIDLPNNTATVKLENTGMYVVKVMGTNEVVGPVKIIVVE